MSDKGKYFFDSLSNLYGAIRRRNEAPLAYSTSTKETQ
jgi:hypothetical protein